MHDENTTTTAAESAGNAANGTAADTTKVTHDFYELSGDLLAKPGALCDIIECAGTPTTLVFCNSPSDADLVDVILKKRGIRSTKLIGNVPAPKVTRCLTAIRSGELNALVVTDIAARLIEVEDINLILNYSVHNDPEVYMHHLGRSGRAGKLHRMVTLVSPLDMASFHYLRKVVGLTFNKLELPTKQDVAISRLTNLVGVAAASPASHDERWSLLADSVLGSDQRKEIVSYLLFTALEMVPSLRASMNEQQTREDDDIEEDIGPRRGGRSGQPTSNAYVARDRNDRGGGRGERNDRGDRGRGGGGGSGGGGRRNYGRSGGGEPDTGAPRTIEEEQAREFKAQEGLRSGGGGGGGGGGGAGGARDEDQGEARGGSRWNRGRNQERPNQAGGGERRRGGERGGERSENDRERREERAPMPRDARIYVGHGLRQGLNENSFRELVKGSAALTEGQLKRFSARENYAFVDVADEAADEMMRSLAEAKLPDGSKLFLRKAIVINSPRENEGEDREEGAPRENRNGSRAESDHDSDDHGRPSGRRERHHDDEDDDQEPMGVTMLDPDAE